MLLLLFASIIVKDPHCFRDTARTFPECETLPTGDAGISLKGRTQILGSYPLLLD